MSMYLDLYILFFEDMFQKYQQNGIKWKFQALDIFTSSLSLAILNTSSI